MHSDREVLEVKRTAREWHGGSIVKASFGAYSGVNMNIRTKINKSL